MVVLTGTATIRFGVSDTVADLEENTHGKGTEAGGLEIVARAGDVFVLPAGLGHKTYDARPARPFKLLSPGRGHGIEAENPRQALSSLALDGFTMMGAYPNNATGWDFVVGGSGEDACSFDQVWSVPKPQNDPVLGQSDAGLCGQWR